MQIHRGIKYKLELRLNIDKMNEKVDDEGSNARRTDRWTLQSLQSTISKQNSI